VYLYIGIGVLIEVESYCYIRLTEDVKIFKNIFKNKNKKFCG
jgi:hypothetical protein